MSIDSLKISANRIVTLLSIFLLIASFGLHAVQIPHSHAGGNSHEQSTGTDSSVFVSLNEYIHGAESKFFILLDQALVLCTETLLLLYGSFSIFLFLVGLLYIHQFRRNERYVLQIQNHITVFFALGILNPKLF